MKITNRNNLPQPFVDAVTPRAPQDGVIRVTELIGAPLIRRLMLEHWHTLTDDASERVWSVFGQSVHALLEASSDFNLHLIEKEVAMWCNEMNIRGRPDALAIFSTTLIDYKVTSVWSILLGDKVEWERQLNVYAHMLRREGYEVTSLENVCILRDWSRHGQKTNPDYPPQPVVTLRPRVWGDAECATYIAERVAAHQSPTVEPCTAEERWEKPTTYAVMKPGLKRATRVLPSQEAAEAFIAENPALAKAEIVKRPGASVRCQDYCPVRTVCSYRAQFVTEESNDQTEA